MTFVQYVKKGEIKLKLNKVLFIFALMLMAGLMVACGGGSGNNNDDGMNEEAKDNVNESGFPIVDDEITLKMFSSSNDSKDFNELPVWNEYEDMTNIKLDWVEQVTMESLAEKRNLALCVLSLCKNR